MGVPRAEPRRGLPLEIFWHLCWQRQPHIWEVSHFSNKPKFWSIGIISEWGPTVAIRYHHSLRWSYLLAVLPTVAIRYHHSLRWSYLLAVLPTVAIRYHHSLRWSYLLAVLPTVAIRYHHSLRWSYLLAVLPTVAIRYHHSLRWSFLLAVLPYIFCNFQIYSPVLSKIFGNKISKQNPNNNFMRNNTLKCVHHLMPLIVQCSV